VAFPYFVTSLVVVLNSIGNATGVVWLPSFPSWYYALARAIYAPFQPYFWLLRPLQEDPGVSYAAYAAISRAPFLVVPLALFAVTVYKWLRRGPGRGPAPGGRLGAPPLSARTGLPPAPPAAGPHRGGPFSVAPDWAALPRSASSDLGGPFSASPYAGSPPGARGGPRGRAAGGRAMGVMGGGDASHERARSARSARKRRATVLGLLALALAAYALVPPLRAAVNAGVAALDPRDVGRLRDYLLGFGPWAAAVSFLLMVIQSVAAPLPAFVITLANGLLFGAFWGGVLSWSSAMAGAAVCYGIARSLGRPAVERLVGARPLARGDAFFERYGTHAVLIARLIPVISFDVISYAAGLTVIRFVPFMVATGIGQLPATVVYSVLGENINTASRAGLWAVGALVSLGAVGLALRAHLDRGLERRAARRAALVQARPTS
jgi:uncharacterized membrane protein YdjX (TVP38/TMEM64 family)